MGPGGLGASLMSKAIFLSASVPDPRRGPEYAATADSVAIQAAVSALVHVTLGRRRLIWGGHPSITPMIWVVAEAMGIDYGAWVTLYQSRHFKEDFPAENKAFQNVIFTEDINKLSYLLPLLFSHIIKPQTNFIDIT